MEIRRARFVDVPDIIAILDEFVRKSRYAAIAPLNVVAAKRLVVECIAAQADKPGGGMCLLAVHKGHVEGIFLGVVRPLYECLDAFIVSNLIWYVSDRAAARTAMRLLDDFCEWADQANGYKIFRLGLTDAIKDPAIMAKLLKRRGFRESGLILEKETN